MYSCLANGSADEFQRGEHIYRNKCVKDPLQIGFHLSATVVHPNASRSTQNVAVTFDRRRISSCNCTCNSTAYWCSHVVAVCLHRIHMVRKHNIFLFYSQQVFHFKMKFIYKVLFLTNHVLVVKIKFFTASPSLPASPCFGIIVSSASRTVTEICPILDQ